MRFGKLSGPSRALGGFARLPGHRWALALSSVAAFFSLASAAQAANITVGSPLTGAFTAESIGVTGTLFNSSLAEPGANAASPVSGAIVRWRVVGASAGPFRLRVLRPAGGTTYTAVGSSSPQTPSTLAPLDFPTNLPIHAGDTIGIDGIKEQTIGALKPPSGAAIAVWVPALAEASSLPFVATEPNVEIAFNAEVQPQPTIASISPGSGSFKGGTSVKIAGTDFSGVTAVSFAGVPAAGFAVDSSSEITAVSPAGKPGAADVAVTTNAGTSPTVPVDAFTYTACAVPSLTGKKLKKAKKRLKTADCKIGKVKRKGDVTAKTGKVVKQNPKPGKTLAPGSKINVTLGG
jgi:hypothetical protein